ncbi:MAG: hypothetical protein Athens071426_418 [Parcubacteria group bacterium Athens0714_26]|nr:MAG: hypothetical protein Athens071426_418 [Parcubacteria group bacterium Athens0714_26]
MDEFERRKLKMENYIFSPEYREKILERLKIQDACSRDKESQILVYALCKKDPIFFINNFGWTFDPRPYNQINGESALPFILFDYQEEDVLWIVDHIKNSKDGFVEKSRDMGITWEFVYVFYWFWLFNDSFSGLLGSYKEALVDNKTVDSLMGKIEFAIRNAPKFLLPHKFNIEKHKTHMKLINPENFNLITGDTCNPNFGRGSRKTAIFYDESAFWDYFKESWDSGGDSTTCRLCCSTPAGRNASALLREQQFGKIDVRTVHWRLHPLKDEEWYAYEKARRDEETIAQELDISYNKSMSGRVYPEWGNVQFGYFPYNEQLPLFVGWDLGASDATSLIWCQKNGSDYVIVDSYERSGENIDFFAPLITGIMPTGDWLTKYNKKDLAVIREHEGWKHAIHIAGSDADFIQQTSNRTILEILKQYGIHIQIDHRSKEFQGRKTSCKLLLRNLKVNSNERTKFLGLCMENAHYPRIARGGIDEVRTVKPVHDFSSAEEK